MSTIQNGLLPLVSRFFTRYSVSQLITFLRNVITMMTGNAAYPTPSPTLTVVKTAVDDLEAKTTAALNRGRLEVAARRAAQRSVLSLARQLSNYVESNCAGSVETLLSSGFDARRSASPEQIPVVPANPRLNHNGSSGMLVFRFTGDGSRNTRNFSVQHAESETGPWIDHDLSTSTRVDIPGLTPGKVYYARAKANAAAGSSDWTVPTSKMAV
jgi:hypothetical protein